jgi:hypothetical protein
VAVPDWRDRVEHQLALLALDDDDHAVAGALGRAFDAVSAELTHEPTQEKASCAIVLGDSEAVALLRFRRRSAVPPALAQQVAAVAVRRWREGQRQQVAEEHAAEEAVTMADLQAELRDVVDVAEGERRTRAWLEKSLLPETLLPVPGLQLSSRY